ncbi:hypothetical protein Rsub_03467 [Raphidocelis subcapitata]|uniref:Solute-binding protein family 3/N-terminal domain-containing protein n=1 Tax=Raphidocelis subcapitata TaxID=307507 RepID=A0A2V0NS60_9CHLO|nr:hypothetical protein Rsub_03467 [Raphidocelis subcapitata]|eukprot:GBF90471.1 hypothetical protein Rsub_03467 [Raphidocelis subcapitata]
MGPAAAPILALLLVSFASASSELSGRRALLQAAAPAPAAAAAPANAAAPPAAAAAAAAPAAAAPAVPPAAVDPALAAAPAPAKVDDERDSARDVGKPGRPKSNNTLTPQEREQQQLLHAQEALAGTGLWKLSAAQAAAAGDPGLAGKIRICANPATPYVFCNSSDPGAGFSGYEIDLFKEVARRVPWLSAGAWEFQCVEYSALDFADRNGSCLISMGGLFAANTVDTGMRSSQSIAEAGYQILVRAKQEATKRKLFSPFYAFSWPLWVALLVTSLVVGFCLWMFDVIVKNIFYKPATKEAEDAAAALVAVLQGGAGAATAADGPAGAAGAAQSGAKQRRPSKITQQWRSMLQHSHNSESEAITNLDKSLRAMLLNLARVTVPPATTTLPSQIVLWAWGILTMITVSMFTGATAAGLTAAQLTGGINSLADLRGRPVVVWDEFAEQFKFTGILPIAIETLSDEMGMLEKLRNYKADAIIMDSNWVGYFSNTECDLVPAGQPWDEKFVAFRFNMRMQTPLIDDINAAIVDAKEDGSFEAIQKRLISPSSDCVLSRGASKGPTVTFEQVAGLWVMLGIAVLAGLVMLFFTWLVQRSRPIVEDGVTRLKSHAKLSGSRHQPQRPGAGEAAGLTKGKYVDVPDV